eukprot:CAMPEP_0118967690 /NCGR_PEP_ID=MMETSP1173-20130426/5046_1 /TAXON_ID=1034831 /ORGANISM="Rhizochromulina marina cf, Strain CCMP1243" /LENGTH=215 /DNA_ID=CAMNT_0006916703 /DNA_START=70 /DNA_END=713 /DNA_ORIENTATION=+
MADMCARRLRKEYAGLAKNPLEHIDAVPLESNIREWHYVVRGAAGTPYEGGFYHGKLEFPKDYPLKPPSIRLLTPSGRFKEDRRLCFSFSDFHPESWNPMWSVSTILVGFQSFMLESDPTLGSIETSSKQRRKLAAQSLEFNCRDKTFCSLFPQYAELYEERLRQSRKQGSASAPSGTSGNTSSGGRGGTAETYARRSGKQEPSMTMVFVSVGVS